MLEKLAAAVRVPDIRARLQFVLTIFAVYVLALHVPAAGVDRTFAPGDEIRTEISCKYTRARLEAALRGSGLGIEAWYTDAALDFAVTLLRRIP